jgi:hypothetical protein
MATELAQVLQSIADLKTEFTTELKQSEARLEDKIDTFNERFDNYQKATQWVVSLAFSLIVSATIITIVSAVFRR